MMLNIQNKIGSIGFIILTIVIFLAISWGITCLFTYWISLLWINTIFVFEWSYEFATGVWLVLILLSGFVNLRVNSND